MSEKLIQANGTLLRMGGMPITNAPGALQGESSTPVSGMPTAGLSGWWVADEPAAGQWRKLADKSGSGKLADISTGGIEPAVVPRRSGVLPALYPEGPATNYTVRWPIVEDFAINAGSIPVGTGQALAVMLVWSRPNQRQPGRGAFSNEAVSLLKVNGTDVLKLAGAGLGSDPLTLFPAGAADQAGSFSLRHTHGVLVQFSGGTANVWLDDGTQLFSGKASSITLGATANLSLLADSQMFFHEAAAWSKVLTSSERANALAYMARWSPRSRPGAYLLWIGQSNSSYMVEGFGREMPIARALSYLTGSLSVNLLANVGGTIWSGMGLYDGTSGKFLDSSGGGDASTWPLGYNGNAHMAYLDGLTAEQLDNLYGAAWYWSESDSSMLTYAKKAEYAAALRNAWGRIRAKLGRTAAEFPILVLNALPFVNSEGCQTHREVMSDLMADASLNVRYMLPQTGDANGEYSGWIEETRTETGGNSSHRDAEGATAYSRRMVYPLARAILSAQAARGKSDTQTSIPAQLPLVAGPRMVSALYEGGTSVLVTVQHDGGTDLVVPNKAAQGVGFTVMDGLNASTSGTPGAPGAFIKATACARVSATQFRLTLASTPQYPEKAQLYYPYGDSFADGGFLAEIGRENAVTDNFASITLPATWQVSVDLGADEQINHPLHATTYGVPLT